MQQKSNFLLREYWDSIQERFPSLGKSILSLVDGELLIVCPSRQAFLECCENRNLICQGLGFRLKRLTIVEGNKHRSFPFALEVHPTEPKPMIQQIQEKTEGLIVSPTEDLIKEVRGYSLSAGIVRLRDNKGLATNSLIEYGSGARPNDWVGTDMSQFWPGEELQRFQQALMKEKEVKGFRYNARLFTGQMAEFVVDARLILYEGDLARIVKHLSCVPVD